jgi:hypothetical protein
MNPADNTAAFGAPGIEPRWTSSAKEGVGTAYHTSFTASLNHVENSEILRLTFSSHDVEIAGRNLRALLLALQDFAVKWLRAIPERYARLEGGENGVITSIRIEAAE